MTVPKRPCYFPTLSQQILLGLILSGALCLAFPIGTALGLVTLVVLTRAEIKARYAA